MPPKVSYKKASIISAAINTIRQRGPKGLSTRNVARQMGGSTQPIYRVFPSIDSLAAQVKKNILSIALAYMTKETDPHSQFLSVGLGYLRFAREEPFLFEFLTSGSGGQWFVTGKESLLYPLIGKMRKDWYLRDLPDTILFQLFNNMFIYTHGLCTLKDVSRRPLTPAEERKQLHDTGGQLIAVTIIKHKYPEQLEGLFQRFQSDGKVEKINHKE